METSAEGNIPEMKNLTIKYFLSIVCGLRTNEPNLLLMFDKDEKPKTQFFSFAYL